MKKLEKPNHQYGVFKGVRLTLDDIEYLSELFGDMNLAVTISDNTHQYDSVQDLIEMRGTTIQKLSIRGEPRKNEGNYKSVDVTFSNGETTIHCHHLSSLYFELADFIKKKAIWSYRALSPLLWIFTALIFMSLMSMWLLLDTSLIDSNLIVFADLLLYVFLTLSVCGFIYRRLDFKINLSRTHEDSFIKRNKDPLLLLFMGAVITLVTQELFSSIL